METRELFAKKLRLRLRDSSAHARDKVAFLRSKNVSEDIVRRVEAGFAFEVQRHPSLAPVLPPERLHHILYPERAMGDQLSWVKGGHLESQVHSHGLGDVQLVRDPTTTVTAGGLTMTNYHQAKWVGYTDPTGKVHTKPGPDGRPRMLTPGEPGYPGPFQPKGWKYSTNPKTTFDDAMNFMVLADQAWSKFMASHNGAPPIGQNKHWSATVNGVTIEGYYYYQSGTLTVRSAYPVI